MDKPFPGPSQIRSKRSQPGPKDDSKRIKLESSDDSSETVPGQLFSRDSYNKKGLADTLHGVIYQLKLLMLFLKRSLDGGYDFNLGSEVGEAEKIDDIVFRFKSKDKIGKDKIYFLQVKHNQGGSNKITANNLTQAYNSKKSDFSLQKYFISFLSIKHNPKFDGYELKDFIIYTNVGFDNFGSIVTEKIAIDEILLQVTKSGSSTNHYKLIVPKEHQIYRLLRKSSHLHVLVNVLKYHIVESKKLELRDVILRLYHVALTKKVLKVVEKNRYAIFSDDFLNNKNLTSIEQNFRKELKSALSSEKEDLWQRLKQKQLKISKTFGKETKFQNYCNELPYDNIKDVDIDDFFAHLVFAVDQPNEVELGDIITNEMGQSSQFNLLSSDLVFDSFQRKMLDWLKNKQLDKGKGEGLWLNKINGQRFFDDIESQMGFLILTGINLVFPEKINRFGITFNDNPIFKEVQLFLSPKNQLKKVLHVISSKGTLLSALNINNVLAYMKKQKEYADYEKRDSYLFVTLKMLISKKIQKYVMDALRSEHNYHFLIIDCNIPTDTYEARELCIKLSEILQRTSKKIIIIAEQSNCPSNVFAENLCLVIVDKTSFNDLTEVSKDELLNKEVIFQGHPVIFETLINKTDYQANEIIDADLIEKLINGQSIFINNCLHELGDHYINRNFQPILLSEESIQIYLKKSGNQSDIFIITGTDTDLSHQNVFIHHDHKVAKNQFVKLCAQNKKSNIHWLESDAQNLIWHTSRGSITNIIKCRISKEICKSGGDSMTRKLITENQLIHSENQYNIHIISDKAGMGKSTVLTFLSMEIKNNPKVWVIRVNLNDHSTLLYQMLNESTDKLLKELLLASQGTTSLDKKLFWNYFTKNEKIAFLFDGFDEICPDYEDKIIQVLTSLKQRNVHQIFVTTRPNVTHELELALGVFSHVLEPLTPVEQTHFLIDYWSKKLKPNLITNFSRLEMYTKSIVEFMSMMMKGREFIGVPLQTKLVAEVFQEKLKNVPSNWQSCEDFLISGYQTPLLPNNIHFLDLFEYFVKKKYFHYHLAEKKCRDFTKTGESLSAMFEYETFKRYCALLALETLFGTKKIGQLLSSKQIQEFQDIKKQFQEHKLNQGLINKFVDGKAQFVHRTFAEYFASFHIADKMFTVPAYTLDFIHTELLNMTQIFIISLITQIDGKQDIITFHLQKPLLHYVISDKKINFVKSLLGINFVDWSKLDVYSKTPLHYAAESDSYIDLHDLLWIPYEIHQEKVMTGNYNRYEYDTHEIAKFINTRDIKGKTALYYAVKNKKTYIALTLLKNGASLKSLCDDDVVNILFQMLCLSCEEHEIFIKNFAFFKDDLVLKSPFTFNKFCDREQSKILSFYFNNGCYEIIKTLLGTIEELQKRNSVLSKMDLNESPLDLVNRNNQVSDENRLNIINYLLKNNSILSNQNNITHILQSAAQYGAIKTFMYFISQENHKNLYLHLQTACQYSQIKIIEYLINNYEAHISVNGNTVLHFACKTGCKLKVMKKILEKYDTNASNHNDETPLLIAIKCKRELNVIEYLISNGAIDWEDKLGNTPLSCAVDSDQDALVACLLRNEAHISEKALQSVKHKVNFFENPDLFDINLDDDGCLRLHKAICTGNDDWALFLIRHGADINKLDIEKRSPLHWACLLEKTSIVELLLQHGAVFDSKDINNKKPRDLIIQSPSKITKLLDALEKLYNSSDLLKELFTQSLVHQIDLEIRAQSSEFFFIVDDWDGYDSTFFIQNARNSQGQTLLHLNSSNAKYVGILLDNNREYLEQKQAAPTRKLFQGYQPMALDAKDVRGNTPLHLAAQRGHHIVVILLLKEGAIFNISNVKGETPEMTAYYNSHEEIAKLLEVVRNIFIAIEDKEKTKFLQYIELDTNCCYITTKNESGKTTLHVAVCTGQIEVVQMLLDSGTDIRAIDLSNNTALHFAAQYNQTEIVKLLLSCGAVYNDKNALGRTPFDLVPRENCELLTLLGQLDILFKEIQGDSPEVVIRKFKTTNIDSYVVDARDTHLNTLLHYAAELCEYNIVEILLKNGAVYNSKNVLQKTPLNLTNDSKIIGLLKTINSLFEDVNNILEIKTLNCKILTNVRNVSRKSLLQYAFIHRSLELIKLLVERGAIIDLKLFLSKQTENVFSLNPYYKIVKFEILKYLIDKSEVNTKNFKGESPLLIAIHEKRKLDVIKNLVDKGSNLNHEDLFGNNPLSRALERGQEDIIKYLIKEGAKLPEMASQSIKNKLHSISRDSI